MQLVRSSCRREGSSCRRPVSGDGSATRAVRPLVRLVSAVAECARAGRGLSFVVPGAGSCGPLAAESNLRNVTQAKLRPSCANSGCRRTLAVVGSSADREIGGPGAARDSDAAYTQECRRRKLALRRRDRARGPARPATAVSAATAIAGRSTAVGSSMRGAPTSRRASRDRWAATRGRRPPGSPGCRRSCAVRPWRAGPSRSRTPPAR
jgi:hypothetical protein